MPWAASSFTLTQVAAGKPTDRGAERAPGARSTPRPMAAGSAVVTPGAVAASMASRAPATTRPARRRPSRSSTPSIVMAPRLRAATIGAMTAQLLAGGPVADAVVADVGKRVEALADRGKTVGLGTILVGDDPASAGYIRKKHELCAEVGVIAEHVGVPGDGEQADLLAAVAQFNADPEIDGYLIQHPVPERFDFNQALLAMDPDKDADGLHPVSLGKLVLQA